METSQNEDKRVKRTKRLLKETLTNLLLEKDIQQITVKSIVERADLNRGTFYLHYTDVYDLLKEIENEVSKKFRVKLQEQFRSSEKEMRLIRKNVTIFHPADINHLSVLNNCKVKLNTFITHVTFSTLK